ncbi:MAG: hypothetical protein JOZ96_24330 [Acidobacteria bacterium]|nr:hypothetical protein [Acidobacteriota bacterium]
MDEDAKVCPFCKTPVIASAGIANATGAGGSNQAALNYVSSLMNRYKDAYLVAGVTVRFGGVIKLLGIGIGVLFALIGFVSIVSGRAGDATFAMGFISIVFGIFAGALFYIVGVLVSAQGQILKASLDGAVNSSPFLADEHRARIMSL